MAQLQAVALHDQRVHPAEEEAGEEAGALVAVLVQEHALLVQQLVKVRLGLGPAPAPLVQLQQQVQGVQQGHGEWAEGANVAQRQPAHPLVGKEEERQGREIVGNGHRLPEQPSEPVKGQNRSKRTSCSSARRTKGQSRR